MTQLTELMQQGFTIQISDHVAPDTMFAHEKLIVVHPVNYSYMSNDDPFVAHEINMLRIQANINKMARKAVERLDLMVDYLNTKHDPTIVMFQPGVEAIENDDGTYSFVPVGDSAEIYRRTKRALSADYLKGYTE